MKLPPGSTDGQIHVFGDPGRYPVSNPNPLYPTPPDSIVEADAMHAAVGIERTVIVQATIYTTDHALLKDVLAAKPRDRYRGVAIIDETVSDDELAALDAVGVRAARFNFDATMGLAPTIPAFHRTIARIAELGWFVKVFARADRFLDLEDEFAKVPIPLVIDHMGRVDFTRGIDQPNVTRIVERLRRHENWWIMLSNGDRSSAQQAPPWDDAVAFGQRFYAAAPDRCIWGSDWPHVHYGRPLPHEADLIALLRSYLPDDAALRAVLVDNPARLYGFPA